MCNKKITPCGRCPNRDLLPLTDEVIYRHLEGRDKYARDAVGLFPMLQDETTYILAIDFDEEGWQEDVTAFIKVCGEFDSINFLSFGKSQESIMRFENADLAGELLDAAIME